MSTKWNFNRNKQSSISYKPLDTDVSHYKDILHKPVSSSLMREQPVEGVTLHLMSGSTFRTKEYNVDDIKDTIQAGNRWIYLKNGSALNLGYVERYEHFTFYPKNSKRSANRLQRRYKDDADFNKRWHEAKWN